MKTILKSNIFSGKKVIKTFTKDFAATDLKEEITKINENGISGIVREIQLDGVYLVTRDIVASNPYEVQVSHDFPLFKLHFEIDGSNHFTPSNYLSTSIYIPKGHYNLFYLPSVEGILSFKTKRRKTLEIQFTEAYIKKIIGNNFKDLLLSFGESIKNEQPFLLWKNSKPITSELQDSIDNIITCEYIGNIKKAYLEAKVAELLVILLAKTNDEKYNESNIELHKADYEKILEVESYIRMNLKSNLTISELASIAGLNTSKLKRGFKIVFSMTIFKYITDLRMKRARDLIIKHQYNITQASYEVGYKNPQHFTIAFKKIYGYLPSRLNKI